MTRWNGFIDRIKFGSKTARLGALAAFLVMSTLLNTGPAQAEAKIVRIDCQKHWLTGRIAEKVVLGPDEDEVGIAIKGCFCDFHAAAVKEKLKNAVADAVARGKSAVFVATNRIFAPGHYPIAPGEKRDFTFYCYTPDQLSNYVARVKQAIAGD